MPPYKTVKQYEKEATRIGKCLVHTSGGAVRRVYQKRHGKLPRHLYVCHHCDNGACILDKHHFVGTQKQNMQDASNKGRLKRSATMKAKVSHAMSTRIVSNSTREKYSEASKQLWQDDNYVRKQMEARKTPGYKVRSSRPRPAQSKALTEYYKTHKYRSRTPEEKAQISLKLRGRTLSEVHKKNIQLGLQKRRTERKFALFEDVLDNLFTK